MGQRTVEYCTLQAIFIAAVGLFDFYCPQPVVAQNNVIARAESLERVSQAQLDQLFELFDSLGFPDLARQRFIWWHGRQGAEQIDAPREFGIVLSETDDEIEYLTLDLAKLHRKTHRIVAGQRMRCFTEVEPEAVNFLVRKAFHESKKTDPVKPIRRPFPRRTTINAVTIHAFVLARIADQRHDELAGKLRKQLLTDGAGNFVADWQRRVGDPIRAAIAGRAFEFVFATLSDPNLDRQEILQRVSILGRKPPSTIIELRLRRKAEFAASILQRMISEELTHKALDPADPTLSTEQRVEELIFRLREQTGLTPATGYADPFSDPAGEASPARQLVAMGFDAVPQLIELISWNSSQGKCFTRCKTAPKSVAELLGTEFQNRGPDIGMGKPSLGVLTVGECAVYILSEIAGLPFQQELPISRNTMSDPTGAERWWANLRHFKQSVDTLPDWRMYELTEQLIANCPNHTLQLLEKRLSNINGDDGFDVVTLVGASDLPAIVPFLKGQVKSAPRLSLRAAAASSLFARGHQEIANETIEAWRQIVESPVLLKHALASELDPNGLQRLAESLIACDCVEGVEAIGSSLPALPPNFRIKVVTVMGHAYGRAAGHWSGARERRSLAVREAATALLYACLEDHDHQTSIGKTQPASLAVNPRVCDFAARILIREFFPDRLSIQLTSPLADVDRTIDELQAALRDSTVVLKSQATAN